MELHTDRTAIDRSIVLVFLFADILVFLCKTNVTLKIFIDSCTRKYRKRDNSAIIFLKSLSDLQGVHNR